MHYQLDDIAVYNSCSKGLRYNTNTKRGCQSRQNTTTK